MRHPEVATRPCELCKLHLYDKNGKPSLYRGEHMKRPKSVLTDCRMGIGCPKGTPEDSRELSPKNVKAFLHYRECKAVGVFPDDPIVRRNAGIIRMVEDAFEQEQNQLNALLGRIR